MKEGEGFANTFREIQPKFSRLYASVLAEVNLSLPQYALLNQLRTFGTMSMTETSKRLNLTKPAITHLVDKLEEKKLLKRLTHPKDRRIILLSIRPKGEKIVSWIHGYSLQMLLGAYDQFDAAGQETVRRFCSAISRELDNRLRETLK
ncbi:MAG: putative HTH-type transcriptional regulator YusO [Candidatus Omnitrophica bacterium ADurb.Bin277]|mgnify:FL=1|nr:MAG: putative HTH-type transcriptional regulator YusO [Candidatus Omnitrophica bacterium ADurb.Bin277]